tara:strand:- start:717 stop:1709 length:993 start_codon:yes stop_codon:yes gene_type:complete
MISAGFENTLVSSIEDDQNWDAQVYVNPGSEGAVVDWAEGNSCEWELVIEMPLGSVEDSSGVDRIFTMVGLSDFSSKMRSVNLLSGDLPEKSDNELQVLMDEGAMKFLGWEIGETRLVTLNGEESEVKIVGITRGELSRTMYFDREDLTQITGVNATSVYIMMPDGVEVDFSLGEISVGIVERVTLLNGVESLIEKQTDLFQAIMYLGLLFTIAVMLNTMIMNVAERDFELATLRVLGASTTRLGIMLLFESVLIGIIGGLIGVLFAYLGAVGLAASFSSWQFYFPVLLVDSVAFELLFGVLIIAVAMTPIGIWRLRNMDLVEKVKDLSN